ncbi:MAG: AAA family ATPase [Smithellaceae bacterium]|nr:AAA family ATPase [Smithellaceae bacterium]
MHVDGLTILSSKFPSGDLYPFILPLFQKTPHLAFETPVTMFAGENGSGKSTLLYAMAQACGIHIWQESGRTRFRNNPYEDRLGQYVSIKWTDGKVPGSFFGSESFQHFRLILDEWSASDPGQLNYFGGKSLMTQSHGESLMSFFTSRYAILGLYLLDEPETALSPKNQIRLMELLSKASEAGHAQFIVATHSPILLACPHAVIYNFNTSPVKPIAYKDTEHYQIYKKFLENQ